MAETILSAGIDIGTSTTQLIFSHLTVANTGGFGSVPKVEVTDKKIVYRSSIYFTPLKGEEMIDGQAVASILQQEYKKAGIAPKDVTTGAVIITGETLRKRNAKEVVKHISEVAGDFVVAAAGPDLESVLSGKGAGAAALSKRLGRTVANLDIGGGTTNISVFSDGEVVDTACYNLGGRLIKIEEDRISYISPWAKKLLSHMSENIQVGEKANPKVLAELTELMAEALAEAVGCKEKTSLSQDCVTNHPLQERYVPEYITFSGGVAECMRHPKLSWDAFGDIGVLLAASILTSGFFPKGKVADAAETLNATVVGAGNYSMDVSGSTIICHGYELPKKNIPVYSIKVSEEEDISNIQENVRLLRRRREEAEVERETGDFVLQFEGLSCPGFSQVESMAEQLVTAFAKEVEQDALPVFLVKQDMAKVLGQAIRRKIGRDKKLLCLDSIQCGEGDFVDLGQFLPGGVAIPVIVKMLLFEE